MKLAMLFEVSTDYLLGDTPRKIEFTEPLESYAAWLRKVGIPISGGSYFIRCRNCFWNKGTKRKRIASTK